MPSTRWTLISRAPVSIHGPVSVEYQYCREREMKQGEITNSLLAVGASRALSHDLALVTL